MENMTAVLAEKGSMVHRVTAQTSVYDAALIMNEHKVGALVVVDDVDRVEGIFTERDVLRRVVAERCDPATTQVADVMTREVVCSPPDLTIEEARTIMRNRRIRHLPIIDEQRQLLGVVSIGDLNAWRLNGQERTIHHLHQYLYGRV